MLGLGDGGVCYIFACGALAGGKKLIMKERKTQEKRKIIAARQAKDVNMKKGKMENKRLRQILINERRHGLYKMKSLLQ